jgi:hypothetical protein
VAGEGLLPMHFVPIPFFLIQQHCTWQHDVVIAQDGTITPHEA